MSSQKGKSDGPAEGAVPKAVVSRLSLYLRELQRLLRDGRETISSTDLGKLLGFTDAQVRKDLAYFGQFGYPGVGYRCEELIAEIKRILGTNRAWPVALIGLGNLGRALIGYRGFEQQGFQIAAAFDVDEQIVGKSIEDVTIYHLDRLSEIIAEKQIKLAIIAVPSVAAQSIADRLAEAGVDGVLNFAPVTLSLPERVKLIGVDLAIELEQLAYGVANQQPDG